MQMFEESAGLQIFEGVSHFFIGKLGLVITLRGFAFDEGRSVSS